MILADLQQKCIGWIKSISRLWLVVSLLLASAWAGAQPIKIAKDGWKPHEFLGFTQYVITDDLIKANSNAAASALSYEKVIDLTKTPILTWRWRVLQNVAIKNQKTKAGDDFAARIYVVKKDKWFFWRSVAINYVWGNEVAVGDVWPNPFTANAHMVANRNNASTGWQVERVNVRKDFKRYFGRDVDQINGIAIMTDSDNSKTSAAAEYADIQFISE